MIQSTSQFSQQLGLVNIKGLKRQPSPGLITPSGDNPGSVANNAMERQLHLTFDEPSKPDDRFTLADRHDFARLSWIAEDGLAEIICNGPADPKYRTTVRLLRAMSSHIDYVLTCDLLGEDSRCGLGENLARVCRQLLGSGWAVKQSHRSSESRL